MMDFSISAQENLNVTDDTANEENRLYEYVSLDDNKVYDVEIIVFAYKKALPNYKTYKNKPIFDDSTALNLQLKPDDYPETDYIMFDDSNTSQDMDEESNKSEFTIAIADEETNKQALVWFEHKPEDYKLIKTWERLIKQPNIVPLIHKAWRQVETPFEDPTYVKLNNIVVDENSPDDDSFEPKEFNQPRSIKNSAIINSVSLDNNNDLIDSNIDTDNAKALQKQLYSDFTLTGMVALSKGRYMHFGHKLNLLMTYQNEENELKNMVFSLIERKQLKTDELNYFDSPWFGSIVKITEFTGEEIDETENNATDQ